MISRYMLRVRSAAVFTLLFLVSACAFTPQTHHLATEPIETHKLFVLTGLGTEDNSPFAASFDAAVATTLRACNIDVKVENVPVKDRSLSLDTSPFVAVNADMAHFAPDAIMRVTQKESADLFGRLGVNVIFITPSRTMKQGGPMIWNGAFRTGSESNAAAGAALAQAIMTRMKQDNVVKGCN